MKPLRAGSSFGISKVEAPSALADALALAFRYDSKAIVEEAIDGVEVGCAIVGSEQLTVGRIDAIATESAFFDYTEKYTLAHSEIHVPARVGAAAERRIRSSAVAIYRALGCTGMARVDQFLTPAGELVFHEVNTIPGMTAHSRFPRMMEAAGISFARLVELLLESVA